MAYIGQQPSDNVSANPIVSTHSGNGSTTDFTLSRYIYTAASLEVFVDNVQQQPTVAYTVSGTTLSFTAAPADGSTIYVVYRDYAVAPPFNLQDGAVTTAKVADGAITSDKIADGTVIASDILDGTITNAKLVDSTITNAKLAGYTVQSANMSNTGVSADTYGGSTSIPVITVDGAGRITSAANTSLTLGTIATQDADDVSISGGNVYGAGLKVSTVSSSSNVTTLDFSTGTVFKSTATEDTTITPTNMPAQEGIMLLKLTDGGTYTISYAGNCAFVGNTAPTLTASGTDYLFIQGNATHYAVFTQLDVR